MLIEFLEKVVTVGGHVLEIEYRDRQEWFTAFSGPIGVGIGAVDSSLSEAIYDEISALKKRKQVAFGGKTYRLRFSKYESFGEWVYRIEIAEEKAKPTPRTRKKPERA